MNKISSGSSFKCPNENLTHTVSKGKNKKDKVSRKAARIAFTGWAWNLPSKEGIQAALSWYNNLIMVRSGGGTMNS